MSDNREEIGPPDSYLKRYTAHGAGSVELFFWKSAGTTLAQALDLVDSATGSEAWWDAARVQRPRANRCRVVERDGLRVCITRVGRGFHRTERAQYLDLVAHFKNTIKNLDWS